MSGRPTGILVLIALALTTYVYVFELSDAPFLAGDDDASSALLAVESGDVTALQIPLAAGGHARLERESADSAWQLVAPVEFAADADEVERYLRAIAAVRSERELDDVGADKSPYGLGEDAPELRVETAALVQTLRIGRAAPLGGQVYVQKGSELARVRTARKSLVDALTRKLARLRDARMVSIQARDVVRQRISQHDQQLLVAERGDDGWRLVEPLEDRASESRITRMLDDFDLSRAIGYVDDPGALADYGLESPEITVDLTTADGRSDSIAMAAAGESAYMRVRHRNAEGERVGPIFEIAKRILGGIPRAVTTLRDRRVMRVDEDAIHSVVLHFPRAVESYAFARSEQGWVAEGHDLEIEAGRLDDLVYRLTDLEAIEILDVASPAHGLDPPRVRVEFADRAGEPLGWFALGDLASDGSLIAASSARERAWRIELEVAEDVPLGVDALRNRWIVGQHGE